jgi:hypothetical protein
VVVVAVSAINPGLEAEAKKVQLSRKALLAAATQRERKEGRKEGRKERARYEEGFRASFTHAKKLNERDREESKKRRDIPFVGLGVFFYFVNRHLRSAQTVCPKGMRTKIESFERACVTFFL